MKKQKVIFLVGPTAAGKTEIAINLTKKINAEIISCDSMQIYKGMDIITSKPPLALRKKVPHHLIDIVSPVKEYNVSLYRQEVLKKIKDILKKGKIPLFVGGTGLYMSVLVDGIFKARSQDKSIRNQLYKELENRGSSYLYHRLKQVDPGAAKKIHPNDTRRIIRALEVYETTGKPISLLQKQRKGLSSDYDTKIFCLDMQRDKLNKKIEERVEKMFRQGLVSEAKKLFKQKLSRTASFAIGLRELKGCFDGQYDLEEAKRLIKRNTRLYAKRQLTWFKKDRRTNWIDIGEEEKPIQVAKRILRYL